jgi:hypothetical protein
MHAGDTEIAKISVLTRVVSASREDGSSNTGDALSAGRVARMIIRMMTEHATHVMPAQERWDRVHAMTATQTTATGRPN